MDIMIKSSIDNIINKYMIKLGLKIRNVGRN